MRDLEQAPYLKDARLQKKAVAIQIAQLNSINFTSKLEASGRSGYARPKNQGVIMKTIFLSCLVMAFSVSSFAKDRVINVFFDAKNTELTVNFQKTDGEMGFIRTNKVVLTTNRHPKCQSVCMAELKSLRKFSTFALVASGIHIATVTTNDPDNWLLNDAFRVIGGKNLALNLDTLESNGKAEVK